MLLAVLPAAPAMAEWTGVQFDLADGDSDWRFDNETRNAQIDSVALRIEERTASGLSVGVHFGYLSVRVAADTAAETERYDVQNLGIYLRQPFQISESVMLQSGIEFRYNSGDDDTGDEVVDIDWSEIRVEAGLGVRFGAVRLMPYASWVDVDGDIGSDAGTLVFERDEKLSQGMRADYYVEPTGFIRLQVENGGSDSVLLSFVRRL